MGDRITAAYLLLGTVAIAISLLLPRLESAVFLLVGVSTTVALIASVGIRRPSSVWPWACMATAFVLFIVDGVTRGSLHTLGNVTATRSLLPDIVALPGYALLAIGLLGFSRSKARGAAQTSVVLDALIAALALASLAWAFVVEPVLLQRQAPNLVKMLSP